MTWFRVNDDVTEHPKCAGLSPFAWTLWLHALAYSSRNLTDGWIPHAMLTRLSGVTSPKKAAAELVDAGLWHAEQGGWRIHDYVDHQRSRAEIQADRAAAAARQRTHRARKKAVTQ